MEHRDFVMHDALTRVQSKLETLNYAQAEAQAALDRARLEREGRWRLTGDDVEHAMTR